MRRFIPFLFALCLVACATKDVRQLADTSKADTLHSSHDTVRRSASLDTMHLFIDKKSYRTYRYY